MGLNEGAVLVVRKGRILCVIVSWLLEGMKQENNQKVIKNNLHRHCIFGRKI